MKTRSVDDSRFHRPTYFVALDVESSSSFLVSVIMEDLKMVPSHILICSPTDALLHLFAVWLEHAGYRVTTQLQDSTRLGSQALPRPDLMVLTFLDNDFVGTRQFIDELRRVRLLDTVPILIAAYERDGDEAEALVQGVDRASVFTMTTNSAALIEAMRRALSGSARV